MKEILYAVLVLGIMGAVFGAVLAIASKVFAVKTDERLPKLVEALPGANCGGCGFAGCQAYAQAVLEGRAEIGLCVAGGQASADRMAAVMGVTAAKTERVVAMVRCRGHHTAKARYDGIHDCRSARQRALRACAARRARRPTSSWTRTPTPAASCWHSCSRLRSITTFS